MTWDLKELGRRIARARDERGMTQEELAHASRITVKTLSRLENGHNEPRQTTVRRIAEALNVQPHDITGHIEPVPAGEASRLDRQRDLARRQMQGAMRVLTDEELCALDDLSMHAGIFNAELRERIFDLGTMASRELGERDLRRV